MLLELLVCFMLLTGSTLMLFAALGLARFGDALCRAHALSKATTFGICTLLLAFGVLGNDVTRLKLVLIFGFLILTIPVASHLVALLMYRQEQEEDKTGDRTEEVPR